jgi:hypothetical protein
MSPRFDVLPTELTWVAKGDVQLLALSVDGYGSDLSTAISLAVQEALSSPCQKSKRGAVAFARRTVYQARDPQEPYESASPGRVMTVFERGHNRPVGPLTCSGSDQCKASCRHLCDHAEAIAVSKWLAAHGRGPQGSALFDVVHIELRPNEAEGGVWEPVPFDREGQPKGPSCITCAKDMLRAEARLVWLWGTTGWRWWYAQDFFRDTLEELKLVDSAMLPRRISARPL